MIERRASVWLESEAVTENACEDVVKMRIVEHTVGSYLQPVIRAEIIQVILLPK